MLTDTERGELKVLADWMEDQGNPLCEKLRRLLRLDDDVQAIVDWLRDGGGVMATAQWDERRPFGSLEECAIGISTGRGHQTNAWAQPFERLEGLARVAEIIRWARQHPGRSITEQFREARRRSVSLDDLRKAWERIDNPARLE